MWSDACAIEDIDGRGYRLRPEALRGVGLFELSAYDLENCEYVAFGATVQSMNPWGALLLVRPVVVEVLLDFVGHELLGPIT
jgi:hypothetical protein|tara:strand:+ start:2157 stop:2402 length:246 start_codon:yes stop_codon:yes gene_type:complete